jgi:hypothetical protein
MGQFKPMVKMETTEPSVELKLKKGGKVAKKADGGMMGSPMGAMPPPARGGMMGAKAPMRPPLAMRRRAMRGMPSGAGPAGPVGGAAQMQSSMPSSMPTPSAPPMKKGGKAKHDDAAQDRAMIKKAMAGKKFATGGVTNGQGGYKAGGETKKMATGGVVKGQGGFATGGVAKSNAGGFKKGGKIKKMADGGPLEEIQKSDLDQKLRDSGSGMLPKPPTGQGSSGSAYGGLDTVNSGASQIGKSLGEVGQSIAQSNMALQQGNQALGSGGSGGGGGGVNPFPMPVYKRGGKASKKAYAAGGTVNSGRPVAMPQGNKPASKPVRINQLAGTYKTGGKVMAEGGSSGQDKYMVKDPKAVSDKASSDLEEALNPIGMVKELYGKAKKYLMPKSSGSVTKESVTVTPAKKRGGSVSC